jgi:hypothetical protein
MGRIVTRVHFVSWAIEKSISHKNIRGGGKSYFVRGHLRDVSRVRSIKIH